MEREGPLLCVWVITPHPHPPAKLSVFVLQVRDLLSYIFCAGKINFRIESNANLNKQIIDIMR